MKIAGFQKQSLIDYPGNISSVIFTQGCNFRCGYCHNPELVLPNKYGNTIDEGEVITYLTKYKHLLDAVCITGGEPTIHKNLPYIIEKIKKLDLKVKLDTNGTNPYMLNELLNEQLLDFISMDIKHVVGIKTYQIACGISINNALFEKIVTSINLIYSSGIKHEFRTTIAKGLHSTEDVKLLRKLFTSNYKIQNYRPGENLNPKLNLAPFPEEEIQEL